MTPKDLVLQGYKLFSEGKLEELGKLLANTWELKRELSQSISNDELDTIYDSLMDLGANGAKLLGAGGGGFFLVHGSSEFRERLFLSIGKDYKILPLKLDSYGSQIIYNAI